jgi:hypothetical protein
MLVFMAVKADWGYAVARVAGQFMRSPTQLLLPESKTPAFEP